MAADTPEPVGDAGSGKAPSRAVEADGRDLMGQLTGWLAEQRVDDAASARGRERWLAQQAEEEGTFAGTLRDLAERGHTVVLQLAGGRRRQGTIGAVAGDFLALRTPAGGDVLLAYAGVVSVRPEPGARPVTGGRPPALRTTLADALVGLAGDRRRVLVGTIDGEVVAGQLRSAGRDVVTLRLDGSGRPTVYLPVGAIVEVGLAG